MSLGPPIRKPPPDKPGPNDWTDLGNGFERSGDGKLRTKGHLPGPVPARRRGSTP